MEIIFLKDLDNLGDKHSIVKVKLGYMVEIISSLKDWR